MVQIRCIKNTKKSKWGDDYEQVLFNNGWLDVQKNSYIYAKFYDEGEWFIINKNSEFLKV